MLDEQTERIGSYLLVNGLSSLAEWALSCGYWYNKYDDLWIDDEGNAIDLVTKILEEMNYA